MYVRDSLCAGDFLTVVPVGLPITLQYNERGLLEKVFEGYEGDKVDLSASILSTIFADRTVPSKIAIQGGTTWVKGVLYTSKDFYSAGELPGAISAELIHHFVNNPNQFKFFAGTVESLATVFKGAAPIRNWLSMSKFNVLPGWIVPSVISRDTFIKLVNVDQFTFKFPLIASYMIYRGGKVLYVPTRIKQFVVDSVTKSVDANGYIKGIIKSNSDDTELTSLTVSYSDIIKYQIQRNSLVILDCYDNIIHTLRTDNKLREPRSRKLVCTTCGKTFQAPDVDDIKCPDPHCMSTQYPNLVKFLKVLNLHNIDYSDYTNYVKAGKLTCIPDVLTLPEYEDARLELTLFQVLSAIVPTDVVANPTIFTAVANHCNNNVNAFKYYINHPDMMIGDLKLSGVYANQLVDWLSDNCNALDIQALLESPQITIKEQDIRFDGAPIFRNRLIMITGMFSHGSTSDIAAILRSYSAEVTTQFSENIHCIVVGDALENIDGVALRNARSLGIAIYNESQFFAAYEIDKDLAENL